MSRATTVVQVFQHPLTQTIKGKQISSTYLAMASPVVEHPSNVNAQAGPGPQTLTLSLERRRSSALSTSTSSSSASTARRSSMASSTSLLTSSRSPLAPLGPQMTPAFAVADGSGADGGLSNASSPSKGSSPGGMSSSMNEYVFPFAA